MDEEEQSESEEEIPIFSINVDREFGFPDYVGQVNDAEQIMENEEED